MDYTMSFMASIYGVSGMDGYIDDWENQDPNYRRALDDGASMQDAPFKDEYKRFLQLTRFKRYAAKLPRIAMKFGARPPLVMHLLAHTDPKWPSKNLNKIFDLYKVHDINIDKDIKYAAFRAKELRQLVKKKHSDLIPSVREAERIAANRVPAVNIDFSVLEEIDRIATDEYLENF